MINLIAAMTSKRVIGKDNEIPWYIPEDFKHFKNTTLDSVVVMGRKTYESIGRPLPKRINIVVSRSLKDENVIVSSSLDDALKRAKDFNKEIYVIGGSEIYKQALPLADCLIISWIKKDYEGNKYFPEVDWDSWGVYKDEDYDDFKVVWYKK